MSFSTMNLIKPIERALADENYTTPTPIQREAIPHILAGKDLIGCAQTGTGKTAAFAVPILQLLSAERKTKPQFRKIRSLILTPTRELAEQITTSFSTYGRHLQLKNTVVYGGVSQKRQTDELKKGTDILIATPGRLLDLINQGFIHLDDVEIFVLDEADRMLDMGFIHDIKKVIALLPKKRQTLLFSATMPPEVLDLTHKLLSDPIHVQAVTKTVTVEAILQKVYYVAKENKKKLLVHLLDDKSIESAIVFTRTKHGADQVERVLNRAKIDSAAIHGNKSQSSRQTALNKFKAKKTRVLVATDIVSRGIDVDELTHVINYDLPEVSETYVHRIGRTGRAGLRGIALSFCDNQEKPLLRDIHKLIKMLIPVVEDHPFQPGSTSAEPSQPESAQTAAPSRPHRGNQIRAKRALGKSNTGRPAKSGHDARPDRSRKAKPAHASREGNYPPKREKPWTNRP